MKFQQQRLLIGALALIPLVLMMLNSDPHHQRHHEVALSRRGLEPEDDPGDLDASRSSLIVAEGLPGGLHGTDDDEVKGGEGDEPDQPRVGPDRPKGPSSGREHGQAAHASSGSRGGEAGVSGEARGGKRMSPHGSYSSGPERGGSGKLIEDLEQQQKRLGKDGEDADGGDTMRQLGPPEPLFYTAEGGVKARQLDAPEDPFLEEMRQWLPAAEALPRSLGRCAVVGNSATLRGAKHGEEVDSADAVFRVNQAPAGGKLAADVGSRTTLRLLNMKWTEVYSSPSAKDWGRASVVHPGAAAKLVEADPLGSAWLVSARTRGSILTRLATRKDIAGRYKQPSPLLLRKAFVGWVHNSLAAFSGSDEGKAQPSTGIMAVFLAMRLCSDVQVFGFSGQVCRGAQHCSKAAHYWSTQGNWIDADRLVTHPAHKFSLEGRLLCALAKASAPPGISGLENATLKVHWDGSGPPSGC